MVRVRYGRLYITTRAQDGAVEWPRAGMEVMMLAMGAGRLSGRRGGKANMGAGGNARSPGKYGGGR